MAEQKIDAYKCQIYPKMVDLDAMKKADRVESPAIFTEVKTTILGLIFLSAIMTPAEKHKESLFLHMRNQYPYENWSWRSKGRNLTSIDFISFFQSNYQPDNVNSNDDDRIIFSGGRLLKGYRAIYVWVPVSIRVLKVDWHIFMLGWQFKIRKNWHKVMTK